MTVTILVLVRKLVELSVVVGSIKEPAATGALVGAAPTVTVTVTGGPHTDSKL